MLHKILNQNHKFLIDETIRKEVIHMLDHDLDYCYYEKQKIELKSDVSTETERTTIVKC